MTRSTPAWLALSLLLGAPLRAQEGVAPPADDRPTVVPDAAREGVQPQPLTLRHRWAPGAKLVYTTRMSMEIDQGPLGTTRFQSGFELERQVKEAREDGATLTETYRQVSQEVTARGQTHTLDTRDGTRSGNPGVDCMEALVGGTLELEVHSSGEVKRVAGGPALLERIVDACPEPMRELMTAQLAQTMSDETLTRQFQEGMLVLPEGELQPDATWRRSGPFPVAIVGELERTIDYVYLGLIERRGVRCAKLWMRTRLSGMEGKQVVIQGRPAVVGISGYDVQTAVLVRAEDGELVEMGPLEVEYGLDLQVAGQRLPIHYKSVISVTTADAGAAAPDAPR